MRLLVAGKWSGLELALEGTCLARLVPKNSPWLLFLPNLLAGEEEDGQTSKSPPPPCPLPSLLMLKEKKKEQPVPLGCDMRKTEFYPKCSREGRVVSLSW